MALLPESTAARAGVSASVSARSRLSLSVSQIISLQMKEGDNGSKMVTHVYRIPVSSYFDLKRIRSQMQIIPDLYA